MCASSVLVQLVGETGDGGHQVYSSVILMDQRLGLSCSLCFMHGCFPSSVKLVDSQTRPQKYHRTKGIPCIRAPEKPITMPVRTQHCNSRCQKPLCDPCIGLGATINISRTLTGHETILNYQKRPVCPPLIVISRRLTVVHLSNSVQ